MSCAFGVVSKKSLPNQAHKDLGGDGDGGAGDLELN